MAAAYVGVQILAATLGVVLSHLMFEMDPIQASSKARGGGAQIVGALIATAFFRWFDKT